MQEFPAAQAKKNWGVITDTALQEPVTITKHGRPSLIVTTVRDYETLQQIRYEKLKTDIEEGMEALDRGEGVTFESEAAFNNFMRDIKIRGRATLKQNKS